MDPATLIFLTGMTVATAYVSYIGFCDVYALVSNAIEDIQSKSMFVKLHGDI